MPPVVLFRPVRFSIVFAVDRGSTQRCNKMPQKSIIRLGLLARVIRNLKLLLPLLRDYLKGTYRDV